MEAPPVALQHDGRNGVFSACWNADLTRLACGHFDGTVRIYDPRDGAQLYVLHGHTASVRSAAWSSNGEQIASSGLDKMVKTWGSRTTATKRKRYNREIPAICVGVDLEKG